VQVRGEPHAPPRLLENAQVRPHVGGPRHLDPYMPTLTPTQGSRFGKHAGHSPTVEPTVPTRLTPTLSPPSL
jgi:hypothetical protein